MHSLAMHRALCDITAPAEPDPHAAPKVPFTTEEACTEMQLHLACRAMDCLRKAAALHALTEAGRVVLSTTHPR